jgi:hypothetical protein
MELGLSSCLQQAITRLPSALLKPKIKLPKIKFKPFVKEIQILFLALLFFILGFRFIGISPGLTRGVLDFLVDGLVGQLISPEIFFPGYIMNGIFGKSVQDLQGPPVQRLEVCLTYLVFSSELPHHQLRIQVHGDASASKL